MARLPDLKREDLDADAQGIWDRVTGSRGSVRGPMALLMHNPPLADRVAELGARLRFQGTLSGADRELAGLPHARYYRLHDHPADHLVAHRNGHSCQGPDAECVDDLLCAVRPQSRVFVHAVDLQRRTLLSGLDQQRSESLRQVHERGHPGQLGHILALSRDDRWQALARAALRDDLYSLHRALTAEVLRSKSAGDVEAWVEANPAAERCLPTLGDIRGGGTFDLTTLPVAVREVRNLLQAAS